MNDESSSERQWRIEQDESARLAGYGIRAADQARADAHLSRALAECAAEAAAELVAGGEREAPTPAPEPETRRERP